MELKPTLCFALPFESAPFIKFANAKLEGRHKLFNYYKSKVYDVLVFGIGKYAAATGVTWLQSYYPSNRIWINVGLCGSATHTLYAWHVIHTIKEVDCSRVIHPEILLKDKLLYAACLTVNKPATNQFLAEYPNYLVDMEAYGFVMGAKNFAPITQIQVLKWVSDRGADEELDLNKLEKIYESKIPDALAIISSWRKFFAQVNQTELIFKNEVESVIAQLKLTHTQQIQLKHAVQLMSFYGYDNQIINSLRFSIPEKIDKTTRNKLFKNVLEKLKV